MDQKAKAIISCDSSFSSFLAKAIARTGFCFQEPHALELPKTDQYKSIHKAREG